MSIPNLGELDLGKPPISRLVASSGGDTSFALRCFFSLASVRQTQSLVWHRLQPQA